MLGNATAPQVHILINGYRERIDAAAGKYCTERRAESSEEAKLLFKVLLSRDK